MFLHQSNRLEALFRQLRAVIREPLADPLAPEIIVVHNQGMAQWVAQQLAFSTGIAAHLQFPLPARFVWDLLQRMTGATPDEDFFCKPVLRWRVAGLLPHLLGLSAFREIAAYLRDDGDGSKLYQLAGRISEVFDQYLVYRPDLLNRWEQGQEAHWQAIALAQISCRCRSAPDTAGRTVPSSSGRRRRAPWQPAPALPPVRTSIRWLRSTWRSSSGSAAMSRCISFTSAPAATTGETCCQPGSWPGSGQEIVSRPRLIVLL